MPVILRSHLLVPVLVAVIGVLGFAPSAVAADSDWHASLEVLTTRIEKLAAAGQVDAAATVLTELLGRREVEQQGHDDRARMALARGSLAAGRIDQALALVQAIAWADKAPAVAADIVGLELEIRFSGLSDADGRLRSGLQPARFVHDSQGNAGGAWQARHQHYRRLGELWRGGVEMVAAEGGAVRQPAPPPWLALARYAYRELDPDALAAALGPPATWSRDLALARCLLELEDNDPELAAAAAEVLWTRHPDSAEARHALSALLSWRARRTALAGRLELYPYPQIEQRLESLAGERPLVAAEVAAAIEADRALHRLALGADPYEERELVEPLAAEVEAMAVELVIEEPAFVIEADETPRWRYQLADGGLELTVPRVVAFGTAARIRIASAYPGPIALRLYRFEDHESWAALDHEPQAVLARAPVRVISSDERRLELDDLDEGFYALTAEVRGCAELELGAFAVVGPDLHLVAGDDGVLAWCVQRATGRAQADERLRCELSLLREVEDAAADWRERSPAWQAGFRAGFTGTPFDGLIKDHQRAEFETGHAAGVAADRADPPVELSLSGTTDADGCWRVALPEGLRGRRYRATVAVDRPEVMVRRVAEAGPQRDWLQRGVAWADRPLVRPGERLGWKVVLRDFDGEAFRLPSGRIAARIQLGDVVLWRGEPVIDDAGTIDGELELPPACDEGRLSLILGEQARHHLATVERVQLPPLAYELRGLAEGEQVRSGEDAPVGLVLRDRHGDPVPELAVACRISVHAQGQQLPAPEELRATTDLGGAVQFAVPTVAGQVATYRADLSFRYQERDYRVTTSWRSRVFPFSCELELRRPRARVGEHLLLAARCPADAPLRVQAVAGGRGLGPVHQLAGAGERWVELRIPITAELRGAEALRVSTPVLAGDEPERLLPITIDAAVDQDDASDDFRLVCLRSRLDPGERVEGRILSAGTGRDALLLAGTAAIHHRQVLHLATAATGFALEAGTDWAPSCQLEAVAYDPARGFVTSERVELEVRPIHRLLRVEFAARDDYRPGELVEVAVRVRDWQDRPVADASLAVGVVNELLYQLAADTTPDLWDYFHSYRRRWTLATGSEPRWQPPRAQLWKAVIQAWEGGAFGHRSGGGRRRAVGSYGGSMASGRASRLLQPEYDAAIHWAADLRTDAEGRALVRFRMPDVPGRFRLTARANDASAAVLVGELRQVLAARRELGLSAEVPEHVRPGDVVPIALELANHRDQARTMELQVGVATQRLELPARARRRVVVDWTAPAPQADEPIVDDGCFLGHRHQLTLRLGAADEAIALQRPVLLRAAGVPQRWSGTLVADERGVLALPLELEAGALVHLRLRAWADVGQRARDLLVRARGGEEALPLQVAAWLRSDEERSARAALAALWPRLGNGLGANLLRQEAWHQRRSAGGLRGLDPDEPLAAWLLARGRSLGMTLPRPGRELVADGLDQQVAIAAVAMDEGWGEADALWTAAMDALEARAWSDFACAPEAARAVAIAADAAQRRAAYSELARSEAARLRERLARIAWDDETTAIIACALFADAAPGPEVPLRIAGGAEPATLSSGRFGSWNAELVQPLRLSAAPAAVVACELVAQVPAEGSAPARPHLRWWQPGPAGYHPLDPDAALQPRRPALLEIRPGPHAIQLVLPQPLRVVPEERQLRLARERRWRWCLRVEGVGDGTWRAAMAAIQPPRVDGVGATTLAAAVRAMEPIGDWAVEPATSLDGDGLGPAAERGLIALPAAKAARFVAIEVGAEAAVAGIQLRTDDDAVELAPLRIARVEPVAEIPPALPVRDRLLAVLDHDDAYDRAFLLAELEGRKATAERWAEITERLDRDRIQALDHLLDYQATVHLATLPAGRDGPVPPADHWTEHQLRRWALACPLLELPLAEMRALVERGRGHCGLSAELAEHLAARAGARHDEEGGLAVAVALRELCRKQQRTAWAVLASPPPAPGEQALPSVATCYRHLATLHGEDADPVAWIARQAISVELLARLGYHGDLAGYRRFLEREFGIDLRLERGIPPELGAGRSTVLPDGGVVVVRLVPGGVDLLAGRAERSLARHGLFLHREGRRWRLAAAEGWRPAVALPLVTVDGRGASLEALYVAAGSLCAGLDVPWPPLVVVPQAEAIRERWQGSPMDLHRRWLDHGLVEPAPAP